MSKTIFKLKCASCGNVEERPAEDCQGTDNPSCSKCYGPMILETVTYNANRKGPKTIFKIGEHKP